MKKILLPSLVCLIAFSGCKKDKNDCATDTEHVSGTYKLTAMKVKPSGGAEIDVLPFLDACEKDDLFILNANGTFNYDDAGTVCSPSGDYNSTWSLSGNTITLDGEAATVSSFDCHTLVITQNDAGDVTTITMTKQ